MGKVAGLKPQFEEVRDMFGTRYKAICSKCNTKTPGTFDSKIKCIRKLITLNWSMSNGLYTCPKCFSKEITRYLREEYQGELSDELENRGEVYPLRENYVNDVCFHSAYYAYIEKAGLFFIEMEEEGTPWNK